MAGMARVMRCGVFAAAGFAALAVGAQAQETLSLERALQIAEASNPTYRQASNQLELNTTEMRATLFDQILPRANLTLFTTQFTGNLARRATDNFGNPIERPEADWVYFSATRQALNLSWSIQGASLFQAYRLQKLANETREASRSRAITELEVSVRRLFMDAQEQGELMRAEEELVDARRVDLEVAERLFGLAMSTRVDVLNAELAIEQQALTLQQQQAAFEQAKLALRQGLGADELGPFDLGTEPLEVFDPNALAADRLVRTAQSVNPELRESQLSVDQASLELKQNRSSWWPSIDMGVNVARVAQTQEASALFDVSLDEELESNFYIQLSIPMFNNYFQNKRSIHQAAVALDNGREAEREVRLRVEGTVRGAVLELRNQHQSLRLAEHSGEIASEALRLAREEYRIGARTFEDLRSAFDQEAQTRRQVITARYSFIDALLSLEEAVGVRIGPDGPMNQENLDRGGR
jgi:outer membrane protein TolC